MKKMAAMQPEAMKQMLEENKKKCICPRCPSYNACMKEKGELLYCASGKSACTVTMKGCICPGCPVTAAFGLKKAYFCVKGTEKEQRGL
jgi:hypothetical protein